MNTDRKVRTIHPEARVIDSKAGIVDYVASDETLDSYREIILANGWKFTNFRKNAPFVDSHDYSCIARLLGKVIDFKVEKGQLIERVQWAVDVSCLAKFGFDMTEKGYLKAVSVGFFPTKFAWPGSQNWAEAVMTAGVPPEQQGSVRGIYLEQEQIELSACIIGANPNALAKAHAARDISDEQLEALGFGTHETFDFLQKAANTWDQPECNDTLRSMITLQMRQIYEAKNFVKVSPTPDSSARERAVADESKQRARVEFMTKLNAVTTVRR